MIIMNIMRYLRGLVGLFETYCEILEGSCGVM